MKARLMLSSLCLGLIACEKSTPPNDIIDIEAKGLLLNPLSIDEQYNLSEPLVPASLIMTKTSNIRARFTNTDRNRLLQKEINYFNNGIDTYDLYQYNQGVLEQVLSFNNPGPDNLWETADDHLYQYVNYAPRQPNIINIRYRGAGADMIWQTADDQIRYYDAPVLDANGNVFGIGTYTTPGADEIWFNEDDVIGWLIQTSEDAIEKRWIMYLGAGPDNDWLSVDDNTIFRFALSTKDASEIIQQHIFYSSAGPDNTPYTDDDTILLYHNYTYDAQQRLQSALFYDSPGDDTLWLTADDAIRSCKQLTRNPNDLPTKTITWRPGVDKLCYTPDDIVWGYHNDNFDNNNLLISSFSFYAPGPDGTWFNEDDIPILDRYYQ